MANVIDNAGNINWSDLISQLGGGGSSNSGKTVTQSTISPQAQDLLMQAFNTAGSSNNAASTQDILDKAAQAFAPTLANYSAAGGYNTASAQLLAGNAQAQAVKQAMLALNQNNQDAAKTQASIAQVLANGTQKQTSTKTNTLGTLSQVAMGLGVKGLSSLADNSKVKGYMNDGIDKVLSVLGGDGSTSGGTSLSNGVDFSNLISGYGTGYDAAGVADSASQGFDALNLAGDGSDVLSNIWGNVSDSASSVFDNIKNATDSSDAGAGAIDWLFQ